MWIAELWRYPVKSMGGERLEVAPVTDGGIEGDRVVHVSGPGGRIITSRTHPRLLGLRGTLGPDGEPLIDHRPWRSKESAAAVRAAARASRPAARRRRSRPSARTRPGR